MESFKVISLSLGGLRNKIFQGGDVVTQEQLPVSVAELVSKGFLSPISEVVVWPSIEDMTAKEIKEALGAKAPKQFMPKEQLYTMLVG
jgi:hypothetical protein